jgi:hypothetical protein
MNDDIRDQIRKLDPMPPGVPTEPPSPELMEDIMATDPTDTVTRPLRNRWYAAAGIAAVALGLAVAIPSLDLGGSSTTTTVAAAAPLELSLGEAGGAMASCLPFDVAFLSEMPLAFEGTVTTVAGEQVTLTVDHWFTGGSATTVELSAPAGLTALIGGIDFVEGGQYLITATEGAVNYCGYSGPSTPEYRAAFEEAFPG